MAIREAAYYWLVCDHPGCEEKSTEGGEHSAWAEIHMAVEEAFNRDWTVTPYGGHFCERHHPEDDDGEA
jgi:hypothetical protein